nr:Chain C, PEPTIDE [Gallus gallus]
TAGQEDYDRL